jgi:hypothetical protein
MCVLSLNHFASIHEAMTQLSGLTVKSSETHVEMGVSRQSRENFNCEKLFLMDALMCLLKLLNT